MIKLTDYLNHIRLIHFSFLIFCTTVGYLIIPNWTDTEKLIEEINWFEKLTQLANGSRLYEQIGVPQLEEHKKSIQNYLKSELNVQNVIIDSGRVDVTSFGNLDPVPNLQACLNFFTGEYQRSAVQLTIVGIYAIIDDLNDIKTLLNSKPHTKSQIKFEFESLDNDTNVCKLTLSAEHNGSQLDTVFKKRFRCFKDTIRFDLQFFKDSIPRAMSFWEYLKGKKFGEAREWAGNQPEEVIKEITLFGIVISPKHIYVTSPILAYVFILYLLAYLTQLASVSISNNEIIDEPPSWVCIMKNKWAGVICWISFFFCPIVSIGLPIWKLGDLKFLAVIFCIPGWLMSLWCARLARQFAMPEKKWKTNHELWMAFKQFVKH